MGGVTPPIATAEVNWRGERLRLGLGDACGDLLPGVWAPPVPAPEDDEGREEGEERDDSELRDSMGVAAMPTDPGTTPTTVEVAEVTPCCKPGFTCDLTKSKCC